MKQTECHTSGTRFVNILLNLSTDLITWTGALPGTYGTSATNRFSGVRAERAAWYGPELQIE
jgi:hypothetical protein